MKENQFNKQIRKYYQKYKRKYNPLNLTKNNSKE